MGGLKKDLPITYWTFLIGALAIAGVPLLAGFFSKDEILYRTFTRSGRPPAALGHRMVTSLLTATYMFRLVFLAFHGERRHDAPARRRTRKKRSRPHGTAARARPWRARRHGHAHHLHDAPPAMAIAADRAGDRIDRRRLRRRAARARRRATGSNVPRAELRGVGAGASARCAASGRPPVAASGRVAAGGAAGARRRRRRGDEATELMLMALSSGVAFAGIGIAAYFWLRNRARRRPAVATRSPASTRCC